MRLIDADALELELFDADWMVDNDEHMVQDILWKQPTIDAVPVVRCKDCEYTDTEVGLPDGALYCNEWSSVVRSHWYCCRGARMDGDADE